MVFLSLAYLLPSYTLLMIETRSNEEDYIKTLIDLRLSHGKPIDVIYENYEYSFELMQLLSTVFVILWLVFMAAFYPKF